jgi:imidazolonepropionase-like amidohydrolase
MHFPYLAATLSLSALTSACGVPHIHDRSASMPKTVITNVHVWEGSGFCAQTKSVVLVGGIISNANAAGAVSSVDGAGGFLMPGFIDTHCHITSCSSLTTMRQFGITTALDLGTFPYSAVSACHADGVTDVFGSGAAGAVNGSKISNFAGFPTDSLVDTPALGKAFVAKRVAEGADYIKLFLDTLSPSDDTIEAIVSAAHKAHKLVITHATTYATYALAERTGVDIITHSPVDKVLDAASIANSTAHGTKIVPTMLMMQSTVNNTGAPYILYTNNVKGSVTALHAAGIPISVGTDANVSPFAPANPPYGESFHDEMALMVAAGLSTVDVLKAATSVGANIFGLYDRGTIKPGLRADLVLLTRDPTLDIENARTITNVWVEGVMTSITA